METTAKPMWSIAADDSYTELSKAPPLAISSKAPPLAKKRPLLRGTVAEAPPAQAPITPGVAACPVGLQAITPGVAAPQTPPVELVPTPPSEPPPHHPPMPPPAPPDWVYTTMGGGDVGDEGEGSHADRGGGGGGRGGGGGGAPNSGWKIKAASLIVALVDDCYVDGGKGPMTAKELAREWLNSPALQMDLERVRHKKARTHR